MGRVTEPEDIIGIDPFDPAVAQAAEEAQYDAENSQDDTVKSYIQQRKISYARVFGNVEDADVKFVLNDLAQFCRAYQTRFATSQRSQEVLEGRAEVYYRIVDYSRQDHDTIYLKLERARMKG